MLGSPNPGQSFGRGLSGPQATEVKMARTEVGRRRISPYIRLIHFWVPHFSGERPDPIRELHFLMFSVFSRFQTWRKVRGFQLSLGGPNYGRYRGEATFFFLPDATDVFPCIAFGAMRAPSV